jgi:dolichyl-phosphate-mannose-protein mannosyltransferase
VIGVKAWLTAAKWSGYAWGAVAATAVFIVITCWWLTVDRSIPIYDPGDHLKLAFMFRRMIEGGNLLGPFTHWVKWPPLGHVVGALATFVGGLNVTAPTVGENLVFVPLLALGCYQTGRLLFNSAAGLLAVLFALGSPLLIDQFHVFILDPPLTALVAVSVWLILASEHFSRVDVAAVAGVVGGLGMLVKEPFAPAVAGLVLVVVLRGGWRNWRGLAVFLIAGAVVGAPWYLYHLSELSKVAAASAPELGTHTSQPANVPATFSGANLLWYFWDTLNWLLLAPLFALAVGGAVWILAAFARDRTRNGARMELLLGCAGAWLLTSITPRIHDIRYGMPLLAYLAVIGTGWIVCLQRPARLLAIAVLSVAVAANTLGVSFGDGHAASVALVSSPPETLQKPDRVQIFTTTGFLSGAPKRDGDVPGLLEALHREGVRTVSWGLSQTRGPDFSFEGLNPLAEAAHLSHVITYTPELSTSPQEATLIHKSPEPYEPEACTTLSDGTAVWVVRYDTDSGQPALFCPWQHPQLQPLTREQLLLLLSPQY